MIGHNKSVSKISLFIADVDGSLVNEDKVLTPRAQAAVKALNAAGVAFAITSGRPPRHGDGDGGDDAVQTTIGTTNRDRHYRRHAE